MIAMQTGQMIPCMALLNHLTDAWSLFQSALLLASFVPLSAKGMACETRGPGGCSPQKILEVVGRF